MNSWINQIFSKNSSAWFLVLFAFILEFLCFYQYVSREIINFYPSGFDQASYLTTVYQTYEIIRQQGIISGFHNSSSLPTAVLFPIQAVLVLFFTGPSRFHLLLINLFYFFVLQFFVFQTAKSLQKRVSFGVIALGLLLSVHAPFLQTGGIADFRIDFIAMCLYGILITSIIRSQIFLYKKWIPVIGFLVILLILLRFITAVYLCVIFALMWFYLAWKCYKNSKFGNLKLIETKSRLINLTVIGLLTASVAIIYYWLNRAAIDGYYVVGHFTGSERFIRAKEMGTTNFLSDMSFYPSVLLYHHLSWLAVILSAFLFLLPIGLVYRYSLKNRNKFSTIKNNWIFWFFYFSLVLLGLHFIKAKILIFTLILVGILFLGYNRYIKCFANGNLTVGTVIPDYNDALIFLALSIAVPLAILTLDVNKSPVVGGIVLIPCIWLILWLFEFNFLQKIAAIVDINKVSATVAMVVFFIGIGNQIYQYHQHSSADKRQNLLQITKMYDDIGNYMQAQKWTKANLSIDRICDYLTSGGISTLYYERHGVWLQINVQPLGGMIFAIDKTQALQSLKNSQIFIVNLDKYPENSVYPFDNSVVVLKPLLLKIAQRDFKKLGDYLYEGSVYRVYVKSKKSD